MGLGIGGMPWCAVPLIVTYNSLRRGMGVGVKGVAGSDAIVTQ